MNFAAKKNLHWIAGFFSIVGLIFTEGSLAVTTKMFGVVTATLIRIAFTIPISWLIIFWFSRTKISAKARNWFMGKQEALSKRANMALQGGKFFVILNTAIFLGPVMASILMVMMGISGKRIYVYAAICALVSAWLWCCFYGGVCWSFIKILRLGPWAK